MIRAIAAWGTELAWREQKKWEREFSRLQYQALSKATGAIQGTALWRGYLRIATRSGCIRQWTKGKKREYVEGETVIKRAMGWRRKAVAD